MSALNSIKGKSRLHYYNLCLTNKDWGRGDVKDALDFIARRYAEKKVVDMLEIGCGVGDIVSHLPIGLRYTGLDPTVYSIEESRKAHPQSNFVIGYAEHLPFHDASFDLVYSFQTAQSFRNPKQALHEIARVTRKGGYILLISPNLECPWSTANSIRHYSHVQKLFLILSRCKDLFFRFFGVSAFRIIPQTYMEAVGIFEKKDDDLKHVVSAWEIVRCLRTQGFVDAGTRRASRMWMRCIGPLQYYGGGAYIVLQKQ